METALKLTRARNRAVAWLIVLLALALMVWSSSCTPAGATPAPPASLEVANVGPAILYNAQVAVPDTLRYTLRWGRGARASNYRVTVTANVAGWSGLPSNLESADTAEQFTAVSPATAWDSTIFTASVVSQMGTKLSAPRQVSWKVVKGPGMPGPIIVDSSLVVIGLELKPDSVRVLAGDTVQFCAFVKYWGGQVANRNGIQPQCLTEYQKLPLFMRAPSNKQVARADSVCVAWTATGGTISGEDCGAVGLDFRSTRVRFNVTLTQAGAYVKPGRVVRLAGGE